MQTLKIKYHTENIGDLEVIRQYQSKYTNVLRWMYNRVKEGKTEKERERLTKSLNNIDILDSWYIRSAAKQATWIDDANKDRKVIFGGKKNFIRRCKGLITKEQFNEIRLQPICSIGEANQKGNRKFKLSKDIDRVVFKPCKSLHIELIFDGLSKNYRKILDKLYICQEAKSVPVTYQLTQTHIYIMFDEKEVYGFEGFKKKENRVFSIDLNPNYIGWSVVDWLSSSNFKVVASGVYSIKELNDKDFDLKGKGLSSESKERKYLSNKRRHEVLQIGKNLVNKALHYQCETFAMEDLSINSSDKERGRRFNKLCNNLWCRDKLRDNIIKRCNLFNISYILVKPDYSSFVGNVLYRSLKLADMVLSSIEIGRRGYEFKKQYIDKKEKQRKNIVFPDISDFRAFYNQSLEELGVEGVSGLKELYDALKKSKFRYRLSLDDVVHPMFSSCFSKRSLVLKF